MCVCVYNMYENKVKMNTCDVHWHIYTKIYIYTNTLVRLSRVRMEFQIKLDCFNWNTKKNCQQIYSHTIAVRVFCTVISIQLDFYFINCIELSIKSVLCLFCSFFSFGQLMGSTYCVQWVYKNMLFSVEIDEELLSKFYRNIDLRTVHSFCVQFDLFRIFIIKKNLLLCAVIWGV